MTPRDIRAHLREMYHVEVSPDLISLVTDGVLEELAEWQSRPLDRLNARRVKRAFRARTDAGRDVFSLVFSALSSCYKSTIGG